MAKAEYLATITNAGFIRQCLPVRARDAHKGDFGRVLLLCGSVGFSGAAILAAKAASRSGSGLVYLGVPKKIYAICARACYSQIVFPLDCDEEGRLCLSAFSQIEEKLPQMDAVLLGCGLGRGGEVAQLVRKLINTVNVPLILDADGINAIAPHTDILRGRTFPTILTPHDGEFSRLGGDPKAKCRITEAMRFARMCNSLLLLKGHRTVVTDGKRVFLNTTGNPGLACGGSGDVLAGILVSFLGQGLSAINAAACAAFVHGKAADICAARIGEYGMIPEDLLTQLPRLLR